MLSAAFQKLIDAKNADIAKMRTALAAHNEHMNYLISTFEQEVYDINIQMQHAEAEDEDDEGWNSRSCVEEQKEVCESDEDEGWRSKSCVEEQKEVFEDDEDEGWLSKYKGPENCKNWDCKNWGANKDDCACSLSPEELSAVPLVASTDALKLKELEERFPGAKMVLSTDTKQIEIRHIKIQSRDTDMIYWPKMNTYYSSFDELGVSVWKRPNLMAEWKGMYIDLTHLFAPSF